MGEIINLVLPIYIDSYNIKILIDLARAKKSSAEVLRRNFLVNDKIK
jgi:hypothetical protein